MEVLGVCFAGSCLGVHDGLTVAAGSSVLHPRCFARVLWEFPKMGDPDIVPRIVGSLL